MNKCACMYIDACKWLAFPKEFPEEKLEYVVCLFLPNPLRSYLHLLTSILLSLSLSLILSLYPFIGLFFFGEIRFHEPALAPCHSFFQTMGMNP